MDEIPALSVIVLSHNREAALRRTLAALEAEPAGLAAERIVVDANSSDGTPDMVRRSFPQVRLLALDHNAGVAGFNAGVAVASGRVMLILDDDAAPAPGVLDAALRFLASRPDVAAVALHPRHPSTRRSEWPFAVRADSASRETWPVMGCGNLVRRSAWEAVGGYEESFFLYRNDVDLALKLLGAGYSVHFDPAWVVWHDSPAADHKSLRWFELATRNWIWVCRRHGRGVRAWVAVLLGWANAHRQAGLRARAHMRTLRGAWAGVTMSPPALPEGVRAGSGLETLIRVRLASPAP